MNNKLKLLSEKGGYQLYQYEGSVHPTSGDIPLPIIEAVRSGDKLKFFVGDLYRPQPENPLDHLINECIQEVDSCGFRNERVDGSRSKIEFAGETLEETIRNLKERTDPHVQSSAHWHDFGIVRGKVNFFGAYHNNVYSRPLAGLPAELIQARLKQQKEYHCAKTIAGVLDYDESFYEQVRRGNAGVIAKVVDTVVHHSINHRGYDSEFVSSVLQKCATNELEYERLQTNLDIRNYLQSRLEK